MALATLQVQGSYATFRSRPVPWNRAMEPKQFVTTLPMVRRTDRFISLMCKSCSCVGAPLIIGSKGKSLKISSFKGIGQSDELGGKESGSKILKNSVKLSYVSHESEKISTDTPREQNVPFSSTSEGNDTIAGSAAIQNLFKNWLTLLRSPSPNQVVVGALEGPSSSKIPETQDVTQNKESGKILKAAICNFLGLNATIKIPLMIFIPLYLTVAVIYGAEVLKELTPLWIFGPLIVALYVKMIRGLCALYVFSFKQSVNLVKNIPTYYLVAYNFIASGKLKEGIRAHIWQPVVDIKNMDYKAVSKRKMKDFEGWFVEKYMDFVESIWPYYCRTIRFLKRANLI